MSRWTLIVAAALGVAGCGGGGGNEAAAAPDPATNLDAGQKQVRGLSADERNAMLLKAIKESGHACEAVTSSQESPGSDKMPVYSALCADQAEYLIAVAAEGKLKAIPMMPAEKK